MKTSSAKAKGRRLQQEVASRIRAAFDLPESDVKSLPMGSQGCDIWMSAQALKHFPFAVECKNVEKLNIWSAFEQAKTNSEPGNTAPMVVFSRNRSEVLVTLQLDILLGLLNERRNKA